MADPLLASTGSLVRRNREIAEVREQLLRADADLDGVQAENAALLEVISEIDTEVFAENARAAVAESRLAEVWGCADRAEAEVAQQAAAHMAAVAALRAEEAQRADELAAADMEAEAERRHAESLEAELERLQARVAAEDDALSSLRQARELRREAAGAQASLGSDAAHQASSEVEAAEARSQAHLRQAQEAKRRAHELEEEVAAERRRREDFNQALRQAVIGHAAAGGAVGGLSSLEAAIAARGGNFEEVLERVRAGGGSSPGQGEDVSGADELRSELRAAESQRDSLRVALARSRDADGQSAERLQAQLDAARSELQAGLRETSDEHHSQVHRLEAEIQEARQRGIDELLAESAAADRAEQLRERRTRLQRGAADGGASMSPTSPSTGSLLVADVTRPSQRRGGSLSPPRCAALEDDLRRVRAEVRAAELRRAAAHERLTLGERRLREARLDGERRTGQARAMLEGLWQALRAEGARLEGPPGTPEAQSGAFASVFGGARPRGIGIFGGAAAVMTQGSSGLGFAPAPRV